MDKLFLSGWACSSAIIPKELHDNIIFFDSTLWLSDFIKKEFQSNTWKEKLTKKIQSQCTPETTIVSWSTGSILLLSILDELTFKEAHIYTPALSFVKSETNPKGTSRKILDSMCEKIEEDRSKVMERFFKNCGFTEGLEEICLPYSEQELQAGLRFLKEVSLPPVKLASNVFLYHGDKDRIIPSSAGEIVAKESKKKLHKLHSSHFAPSMFEHFRNQSLG